MTAIANTRKGQGPNRQRVLLAIVVALGLSALLAAMFLINRAPGLVSHAGAPAAQQPAGKPDRPLPVVEPLVLDASKPDEARKLNAEIPFSTAPNPAARPFRFAGDGTALARATDCLAAAMIYEAGDDAKGEQAVGQVVLNRLRHPAFPKTVCGVVFQGQERSAGCQFTFTCDGAMARIPSTAAWDRARALAGRMLAGDVYAPVGYSTHYHTDWVMPYWSRSLDKVAAVDTHLFFRWPGWWGTPGAFQRQVAIEAEPAIQKLAILSPIHRATEEDLFALPDGSLVNDGQAPLAIGPEQIGQRIGPGTLRAIEPGGAGFVMTLDKGGNPARYVEAAARICSGRAQCRLMAWTNPKAAPHSFPVAEASLPSMSFSYIRMKETGLERTLYNCDEFPQTPRIQCMTRRIAIPEAPRIAADERADQARERLRPGAARPAADAQGNHLPDTKPIEVIRLRVPGSPPSAETRTPGAS